MGIGQRRCQVVLLAVAMLGFLSGPTYAAKRKKVDPVQKTVRNWTVSMGNGFSVSTGGQRVLSMAPYGLTATSVSDDSGFITVAAHLRDKPEETVAITYRVTAEGVLTMRVAPSNPERKTKIPMVLASFAGGDLAGTTVWMDGEAVRVPETFEKHEFRHARGYSFFRHQPSKRVDLEIRKCAFANLRDFRRNGRADLQLFVIPPEDNVIEIACDLSKSLDLSKPVGYPGQEYLQRDDLHLPNLSLCPNLVQNPSFEGGLNLWSWGVTDLRPAPVEKENAWVTDASVARTGCKCARFTVAKGHNPAMLCTFPVAVTDGEPYTVSFYAKTDRPGVGLSVFVHTAKWGKFPGSQRFKVGADWQRYTFTFKAMTPFLRVCLGERWWDHKAGDQIDGARIWVDDVQLESGENAGEFAQKPVFAYSATHLKNNVLFPEDGHSVRVTLVNSSPASAACSLDASVQRTDRQAVAKLSVTEELPAWGEVTLAVPIDPGKGKGLLRVVMDAKAGVFGETFYGRVAVCESITSSGRVRYGYHRTPTLSDAAYLRRLGVWGSLSFRPPEDVELPRMLADMGWHHIFTAASGRECPVKVFHQDMTDADWNAFDTWVGERIARFKHPVLWKTLNEPNCGGYTWTPADCARGVEIIRRHAKAVNPDSLILTPDPYNASRGGQSWMEGFFQAGGNKLVDVLAIHTYRARPEAPDLDHDIQCLKELKSKYGLAQIPIMFTEGEGTATYSIPAIGMTPFRGFFEWRLKLLGLDVGRSELAAAALMTRTLLACFKNNDDVKFYLSWRDDICDGQPMASLCAINRLYGVLRDAEFLQEHVIGNATKTYVFQVPDGPPVAVLWSHDLKVDRGEEPPVGVAMPLPDEGWHITDMMGNPVVAGRVDGNVTFELSGHPVYVIGDDLTADALNTALTGATIGGEGVKPVDLQVRLTGSGQGVVHVASRLTRPLAGELSIAVAGQEPITKSLTLDVKASTSVPFSLGNDSLDTLNVSDITIAFNDSAGNGSAKHSDSLRWLTVPRLPGPITIDGKTDDWAAVSARQLNAKDSVRFWKKDGCPWQGPDDLSADIRAGYADDGLYLAVTVRDDTFSQTNPITSAWRGDSLQVYIDLMADGHDRPGIGYDSNDQSLYVAKVEGKDTLYRDYTPEWQVAFVHGGEIKDGDCVIARDGTTTTYEVKLPLKQVFPLTMKPGTTFGLAILVNDADADGKRKQALTMTAPNTEPHRLPELWPHAVLTGGAGPSGQ